MQNGGFSLATLPNLTLLNIFNFLLSISVALLGHGILLGLLVFFEGLSGFLLLTYHILLNLL